MSYFDSPPQQRTDGKAVVGGSNRPSPSSARGGGYHHHSPNTIYRMANDVTVSPESSRCGSDGHDNNSSCGTLPPTSPNNNNNNNNRRNDATNNTRGGVESLMHSSTTMGELLDTTQRPLQQHVSGTTGATATIGGVVKVRTADGNTVATTLNVQQQQQQQRRQQYQRAASEGQIYSNNHTNPSAARRISNYDYDDYDGDQQQQGVNDDASVEGRRATSIPVEAYASGFKLGTSERNKLEALLKQRRQLERRRAEEQRLKEQCTFQPKTNEPSNGSNRRSGSESRPRSPSAADPSPSNSANNPQRTTASSVGSTSSTIPVEDRLLGFEKQRRAKLQYELLKKIEADRQQCSFQPMIDHNSVRTAQKLHPSSLPVEDRLMHYKASVELSRRLLQERRLAEEDAMVQRMSTPMTTNNNGLGSGGARRRGRTNSVGGGGRGGSNHHHYTDPLSKPFLQRMQEAELQRQASVAALKDKELANCTFKPSIAKMSELYCAAKEQRQLAEMAALSGDEEAEMGGHQRNTIGGLNRSRDPQLAITTTSATATDPFPANRVEALYKDAEARQRHLEQKRFAKELQEVATCGKPYVSAGTEKIISDGPMRDVYSCDFVQRQEIFQQLAKDHAHMLRRLAENKQQYKGSSGKRSTSFSKSKKRQQQQQRFYNANGDLVVSDFYDETDDDNLYDEEEEDDTNKLTVEAMEEQVDRLYTRSTEVSKQLRELLAAERQKAECTFQPTLSPATVLYMKQTAQQRPGDVVERLTKPKKRSSADDNQQVGGNQGGATTNDGDRATSVPRSLYARGPQPSSSSGPIPQNSTINTPANSRSQTPNAKGVTPRDADRFYRRQLATVRQKERLIAQQQAVKAIKEQEGCTFQPDIQPFTGGSNTTNGANGPSFRRSASAPQSLNTSVVSTSQQQPITGMSAFLKRQEAARAIRREKEQLMADLGKGKPCNGPNYTVVRPFKLHGGRGMGRDMVAHFDPTTQFEQPVIVNGGSFGDAVSSSPAAATAASTSRITNTTAASGRSFGQPINPNVSVAYPFMPKGSVARAQYDAATGGKRSTNQGFGATAAMEDETTAAVNALLDATEMYTSSSAAGGDDPTAMGYPAGRSVDFGGSPPSSSSAYRHCNVAHTIDLGASPQHQQQQGSSSPPSKYQQQQKAHFRQLQQALAKYSLN